MYPRKFGHVSYILLPILYQQPVCIPTTSCPSLLLRPRPRYLQSRNNVKKLSRGNCDGQRQVRLTHLTRFLSTWSPIFL